MSDTTTTVAAPSVAENPLDFINDLDDDHLQCRELGHLWRKHPLTRDRIVGYVRRLACINCRTVRVDHIGHTGVLLDRYYEWPDGYRAPTGAAKWGLSRMDFRREAIRREGFPVQAPPWEDLERELGGDGSRSE